MSALRDRPVLVTGATGFIGSRLVECLALDGRVPVRALVRSYSSMARIARFPIDVRQSDILDAEGVASAAEGCSTIFHLAYGSRGSREERREITVRGTRNAVEAARRSGARLVHVSSQAVYGETEDGALDETTPRRPTESHYASTKREAEDLALAAAEGGLPVVVLQPTAVYGPYAPVWTAGPLEQMRRYRMPLVDGGEGCCNAVYVDDVIEALLAAASADADAASGEAFLISAAQPVTWRAFYGRYEAMLGEPATVEMSTDEALAHAEPEPRRWFVPELVRLVFEIPEVRRRLARTREGRWAAALARKLRRRGDSSGSRTPELDMLRRIGSRDDQKPVKELSAHEVRFYASRTVVRIDKARRVLGYEPRYDLEAGMRLTEAWARWAELLPRADRSPVAPSGSSANWARTSELERGEALP